MSPDWENIRARYPEDPVIAALIDYAARYEHVCDALERFGLPSAMRVQDLTVEYRHEHWAAMFAEVHLVLVAAMPQAKPFRDGA